MSRTKISVRIDNNIYKKLKEHELPTSKIVRKALNQYFRGEEPNTEIDHKIIESYEQMIILLRKDNDYLREQIEDWKNLYASNISIWQKIKLKLLNKQPKITEEQLHK
jgi:hypothetical protein